MLIQRLPLEESSSYLGTPIPQKTLGFLVSNPNVGDNPEFTTPSGLRVTASDAVVAAVPEPASWAMMLIGFGAIGFTLRFRRRRPLAQVA